MTRSARPSPSLGSSSDPQAVLRCRPALPISRNASGSWTGRSVRCGTCRSNCRPPCSTTSAWWRHCADTSTARPGGSDTGPSSTPTRRSSTWTPPRPRGSRLLELGERLEAIEAVKAGRTSHHPGIRLLLPRQPRSAQILTADSVQQQPVAAPEGSEINHGIHRNSTEKRRLLTELHHSRAARIRVAGGGAGGDAPDAQASAWGFPTVSPSHPSIFPHHGIQRITVEFSEKPRKENPNQLPLSVSFPGATPAHRVGSFRGCPLVMIFLAVVIPDGRKVGQGGVSAVVTEHNCHPLDPRCPCRQPTLTLSFRKQPSSLFR